MIYCLDNLHNRAGCAVRTSKKSLSIKLIPAMLAVLPAVLPLSADAAGLGRLAILNHLGQPLKAEVDLSATREELSTMTVKLASPEAFKQAGIEYSSALSAVHATVVKTGGKPVIRLTSDKPVNEPFLDMLLEVNWASGRLVREYTFLFDPADMPAPVVAAPVALPESKVAPAPVAVPAPQVVEQPVAKAEAPIAKPLEPRKPEKTEKPVEKPVAAKPASSDSYTVKKGDTLGKIASAHKPEGVSLDQALVALFRANPQAFDGGNMNRLHSGRILNLPDRAAIESVTSEEARKTMVAQTADFEAYRRSLAGAAASAPAKDNAAKQSAAGKIESRVEDRAPAAAKGEDKLTVSKTAEARDGKSAARITALQDDVVAKEKALKEANSRLADLERNVKDLQKLVDAKNQSLADLQKQAEAKNKKPEAKPEPIKPIAPVEPEAKKPEAPAGAVPDLLAKAEQDAKDAAKTDELPATEVKPEPPKQEEPKVEEAKQPEPKKVAPPPPAPPVEEPGFIAGLVDNPLALGGIGLVLVLFGVLGVRRLKAKDAMSVEGSPSTTAGVTTPAITTSLFGQAGGASVDTGATSLQTDFSQSSLTAIDTDEGVDPVAEADVYMAYGRDAQAEEILLEALKTDPARHAVHLKLLEIYAQRKSNKQFEQIASELYAQTGGVGADWEKAAALGRKVDGTNLLYGGTGAVAAVEAAASDMASHPEPVLDLGADVGSGLDFEPMDSGLQATSIAPLQVEAQPEEDWGGATATEPTGSIVQASATDSLDFDIGAPVVETDLAKAAEEHAAEIAEAAPELPAASDGGLDFDLGASPAMTESHVAATVIMPVIEEPPLSAADSLGSGLDFDLDDMAASSVGTSTPDVATVDLEKTDIGNLVDFNFEMGDAVKSDAGREPVLDLSDISLDLPGQDFNAPMTESRPMAERANTVVSAIEAIENDPSHLATTPFPMNAGDELVDDSVAQEVETKLELARAYEEMGDKEGARELLQEVLKEGTLDQQTRGRDMLARIS